MGISLAGDSKCLNLDSSDSRINGIRVIDWIHSLSYETGVDFLDRTFWSSNAKYVDAGSNPLIL